MSYVLTDSGFWMGLFEERDEHHRAAEEIYQAIFMPHVRILIPWPSLYETINTRAVRKHVFFEGMLEVVQRADLLDDAPYRQEAISTLHSHQHPRHSLVDRVIHYMLEDTNLAVDYFVTFNARDFNYVCQYRGIEIIDESWP